MKIEILEITDLFCRFILSDVDVAFANALRRSMMCEVPTMAIDDVNIYENTSVLYDEQIALRLALIPLKTDLDSYVFREECKCENGCGLCQVTFTLNVESPEIGNEKTASVTVYSGDLFSSNLNIYPAKRNIPILKLITVRNKTGVTRQKIMLEAIAILGRGKEHAKWQPVIACGYKNIPNVIISERCVSCGKCVDVCPRGVLGLNDKKLLRVVNELECSQCRLCEEACPEVDLYGMKAIKIDVDKNAFLLDFELTGSFSADELVIRAADTIECKAGEFMQELSKKLAISTGSQSEPINAVGKV
jgi:DNA-directed RNA polymerase subunit D